MIHPPTQVCNFINYCRGEVLNTSHYKNLFRDQFDPIFLHKKGRGTKIPQENFKKIGFETKKYHFCVLVSSTVTAAILHPKFEKVIKTTQNVPKTVDNHQEQLVLGLGYQFLSF